MIRADILNCTFRPGTKLKISKLCTRYGLSLGSVREALFRLSSDGLVVAEAQKGYSAAPVSKDDLADLTKARIEIESVCLTDAIENGDLRWESEILAAFHRLIHLPEKDPADEARLNDHWAKAHREFHLALVAACSSKWLLKIRLSLYEQAERYRQLSVPLRLEDRDVGAEHRQLLTATMARDVKAARQLMATHLSLTTRLILDGLDDMSAEPARPDLTLRQLRAS